MSYLIFFLISAFFVNFCPINKLLSTQNVNVARYARNVEWDFLCDFQTPWSCIHWQKKKSKIEVLGHDTNENQRQFGRAIVSIWSNFNNFHVLKSFLVTPAVNWEPACITTFQFGFVRLLLCCCKLASIF